MFLSEDRFEFRQPTANDALSLIRYNTLVFSGTDQLLTYVDEYTINEEQEKAWIEQISNDPAAYQEIALYKGEIVGFVFFMPFKKRKNAHVGELGINVHPDYRGQGIGTKLINNLMLWAHENPLIEKVVLEVFATNDIAKKLYINLGFQEEGRFVKQIKQVDGAFVDVLRMYKWVGAAPEE